VSQTGAVQAVYAVRIAVRRYWDGVAVSAQRIFDRIERVIERRAIRQRNARILTEDLLVLRSHGMSMASGHEEHCCARKRQSTGCEIHGDKVGLLPHSNCNTRKDPYPERSCWLRQVDEQGRDVYLRVHVMDQRSLWDYFGQTIPNYKMKP
jgi:hypothetical protein